MSFFGPVITFALTVLTCHQSLAASQSETGQSTFRFHIPSEPTSLDPLLVQSTDASYFLNNVSRGLYSYSQEKGLVTEGASSCVFVVKTKLRCALKPDAKWSDGSQIVAEDYVRGFTRLVSKESRSPAAETLKNVKNAVAAHGGKVPIEQVGIKALSKLSLEIEFEKPDPEFLYKLTTSVLVPVKSASFPSRENSHQAVVNGPYKVSKWTSGRRVSLKPNPFYTAANPKRPLVEALFIDDDQTALHLYEEGELNFLRRLPTTEIPRSKKRADFLQVPMARFDYIGFGKELKDQPKLREALSYALDFKELAKIYDALGIPGCPSLPRQLMADEPCVTFDLERAKKAWNEVPKSVREKRLKLVFSKLGGDDVKKGAEWFQAQWKKHLSATVDVEAMEQGVYLSTIRENPPTIFRKGVGLDRPTCLAALETFAKGGPENFVDLNNPAYEQVLVKLENASTGPASEKTKKQLCTDGVKLLLSEQRLIPLGRIHFTLLARPAFKGWKLNEMNQLDLSQLQYSP